MIREFVVDNNLHFTPKQRLSYNVNDVSPMQYLSGTVEKIGDKLLVTSRGKVRYFFVDECFDYVNNRSEHTVIGKALISFIDKNHKLLNYEYEQRAYYCLTPQGIKEELTQYNLP